MVAGTCYSSLSHLQKMYRHVFGISIGEYITKRRMTLAAFDLTKTSMSVTDIAMKYQYNSPEVFSRAFNKTWHITPSEFKKKRQFSNLFPKIIINNEGENRMPRRRFDITELYDYLKKMNDRYAVTFDTVNLMKINNTYGTKAGDRVISECLCRIDEASGDEMLFFRIGADEYVLVTEFNKKENVLKVTDKILAQNGNNITVDDIAIPVSMRAGAMKIESDNLRYGEVFGVLSEVPRINNKNINQCSFVD